MAKYYLYVKGTSEGYRCEHDTIEKAINEAKRLHEITNRKDVEILEVVGYVKRIEKPVIEYITEIKIDDRLTDDLPF